MNIHYCHLFSVLSLQVLTFSPHFRIHLPLTRSDLPRNLNQSIVEELLLSLPRFLVMSFFEICCGQNWLQHNIKS